MKTEELIDFLAAGSETAVPHGVFKWLAKALAAGAVGALLVMLLGWGPRPDLASAFATAPFLWRMAFMLSVIAIAYFLTSRLARPGLSSRHEWLLVAAPFIVAWLIAAQVLLAAPERHALLFGATWKSCSLNIAAISIPVWLALMWSIRGLATTRFRITGFVAGFLAGAIAALVYCFTCDEMSVPFWSLWFFIGMLLPAIAGALCSRWILRW
ncbi:DUF1109 domain-containing protein [Janthinobacterium agaricidamnosum]|uniref:Transmembrane protein n=1 Tax=Janthinobacterium agaricidamnosum NBRC 102515 = DSM 9628 TaxID=1349767 RepID=W0V259_9BURK|nr:DUF1109 domain-containing protein [Janthinobacterium agaricidamnosum]CDG81715.1 conserved hypothetical protein [Janthinobacterium agaricidamnosum NBRC 102515 = DSM 9628]